MRHYSPLRYPGGKAKLSEYIKLILKHNFLFDGYYVEPYCGGASIAFDLLLNEFVSKIIINDIDKAIYAFWHSVLYETEKLCRYIIDTPITIEQWEKHRDIYREQSMNKDLIELGFSMFFLNRTNRSGILKGGVIGGLAQNGKWKIDARFNKKDLVKRIQKIALYRDRINISNQDALVFLKKIQQQLPRKTLIYLDPPYYNKGKDLYLNYYNDKDHRNIAKYIKRFTSRFWIISYDDVNEIRNLYTDYPKITYKLNYSANNFYKGSEVIIFSKKLVIPDLIEPTDKTEIKKLIANDVFYL
jgi:DNA adenine methylase